MVIRQGKYVCEDCGAEFLGMEYEVNGTAETDKTPCPHCGSKHSHPKNFWDKLRIHFGTH